VSDNNLTSVDIIPPIKKFADPVLETLKKAMDEL
jgi:hypothetical protein